MALLEIKNLSVCFGNKKVVDEVSFAVNAGEVIGLVGESGSGKSVTALSILNLLPKTAKIEQGSSIKFNNIELVNNKDIRHFRGNEITFIFQEPLSSLNPLHTIGQQITEVLLLHKNITHKAAKAEAVRLLELTGIQNAKKRINAYPFELSGGQRQRVMIAMAVANNPKILIADEPTTALDVTVQKQILELLLELKEKLNMAIIFISHDLHIINKICNKVNVMHNGKIVECGDVNNVFLHPQEAYTQKLLSANPPLKDVQKYQDVVLTACNIKVCFPLKKNFLGRVLQYVKAVDGVSLELQSGETLGIVGESGSGKTTLGMALANLISFEGEIIAQKTMQNKEFRRFLQIVFQDPYNSLNPRMNVLQIVSEGMKVHFPQKTAEEQKNEVCRLLTEVGLSAEDIEKYPHQFSGGQRQRIAVARALAVEPKVLILDEPTSALDVTIQAQLLEMLQKIQRNRSLSYIFISHDMEAVYAMSDRVAVMKDGKFVESGSRESIFNNPQHSYTKQLISARK